MIWKLEMRQRLVLEYYEGKLIRKFRLGGIISIKLIDDDLPLVFLLFWQFAEPNVLKSLGLLGLKTSVSSVIVLVAICKLIY